MTNTCSKSQNNTGKPGVTNWLLITEMLNSCNFLMWIHYFDVDTLTNQAWKKEKKTTDIIINNGQGLIAMESCNLPISTVTDAVLEIK